MNGNTSPGYPYINKRHDIGYLTRTPSIHYWHVKYTKKAFFSNKPVFSTGENVVTPFLLPVKIILLKSHPRTYMPFSFYWQYKLGQKVFCGNKNAFIGKNNRLCSNYNVFIPPTDLFVFFINLAGIGLSKGVRYNIDRNIAVYCGNTIAPLCLLALNSKTCLYTVTKSLLFLLNYDIINSIIYKKVKK